ncbi:phosphotyrosine protein phosphatase [Pseudoalteromonas luteoviolacea]|uniref:Phosphotyrosine protein phosphatase n=1 Tax=Pseudoalteromonas luteoviolacea TaxID=43657 RepID=A0A1C0TPL0_9GAMM|nr:phosphotyrosine protein phosphatase [Pseudoalteromonas luteoviolacea]MBQ4811802.1 phosphotyrosine protein phosphatase [Pseudoalteromonas luteoviolacea]OCQ20846.1 phosphotyrosine protein phosphatase [Pseudoalteromonas luteoviolacea]
MCNVLFICSRNQWRSPTGEQVWKNHSAINVRSAGTSPRAKKTVNTQDIQWADIIFTMEEKHKCRLKGQFARQTKYKDIRVLDVPDEYRYMDPALVQLFKEVVSMHLGISYPFNA